jgi:hypothetical protein
MALAIFSQSLYKDPHPTYTYGSCSPMITPTSVHVHSESPTPLPRPILHLSCSPVTKSIPTKLQSAIHLQQPCTSSLHARSLKCSLFPLKTSNPHQTPYPRRSVLVPLDTEHLPAVRLKSMYMIPAVRLMKKNPKEMFTSQRLG